MTITTEQIKALREETGISIMLCRKALEEAGGNIEKAKVILQRRGAAAAEKKADRSLGAGTIAAYIHHSGAGGALVELASETDFVSGNEAFRALAYDIAMHVAASRPEFITRENVSEDTLMRAREVFAKEAEGKPKEMREKILEGKLNSYLAEKILLDQPFIKNPDQTIRSLIEQATQKFGEKIAVTRFARFATGNRA